jgi:hypothetical protein
VNRVYTAAFWTRADTVLMKTLTFKGTWDRMEELKRNNSNLTPEQLAFLSRKEDELLAQLQQRLGRSKEDIRREIDEP